MNEPRAGAGHRVTVVGGGVAALETVLALRDLAGGLELELVAPESDYEFKPLTVLVPSAMGDAVSFDLSSFAEAQHVTLRRDTLVAVDPQEHSFTSGRGETVSYELLVMAVGARKLEGVPGATLFRGSGDERAVGLLLDEYTRGGLQSLAFTLPAGASWSLPLYELALLAAATLPERGATDVQLTVASPESAPLEVFGTQAADAIAGLLEEAGIELRLNFQPGEFSGRVLSNGSGPDLEVDRVVALPRLAGHRFPGLPSDGDGFIPVDGHGAVTGIDDVYAAGDITDFPIKQGGLATQQADAVAEALAARVGAEVEPAPFHPVLRGLLLAGLTARYLETPVGGAEAGELVRPALWSPSSKVFGKYLLPYLSGNSSVEEILLPESDERAVPVEAPTGT